MVLCVEMRLCVCGIAIALSSAELNDKRTAIP